MGVAADDTLGQTPKVSSMRRLPLDNAVVRSSKLGCNAESWGMASINAMRAPRPPSATPRLAPSRSIASGVFSSEPLSTSAAPLVTSTSSSIRMPMFQNSLDTRGDGRM